MAFKMKRWMLFCYDNYYPTGGANDLEGVYNTVACCIKNINRQQACIFDTHTGTTHRVPTTSMPNVLKAWAQQLDHDAQA